MPVDATGDEDRLTAAVAQATGEEISFIRQRGFQPLDEEPATDFNDVDAPTLAISCPGCGRENRLQTSLDFAWPEWAECHGCDSAYPYQSHELHVIEFSQPAAA